MLLWSWLRRSSTVVQELSSTFSTVLSLIPPATPMIMLLRIAIPPGPEAWEVILSLVLCIGFTLLCVKIGAKVFRIGILAQGQAPSFGKLVGWVFSK